MAFSLPNIVLKQDPVTLLYSDRPLCTLLPYDSGTPKYLCGPTKMDISHWGAAVHYGVQLTQHCD